MSASGRVSTRVPLQAALHLASALLMGFALIPAWPAAAQVLPKELQRELPARDGPPAFPIGLFDDTPLNISVEQKSLPLEIMLDWEAATRVRRLEVSAEIVDPLGRYKPMVVPMVPRFPEGVRIPRPGVRYYGEVGIEPCRGLLIVNWSVSMNGGKPHIYPQYVKWTDMPPGVCEKPPGLPLCYTVSEWDDRSDAAPGDGICEATTGKGDCTLRAAVEESNQRKGPDRICIPAGTVSIDPGNSSLEVGENLVIEGAGQDQTRIEAKENPRSLFRAGLLTLSRLSLIGPTAGQDQAHSPHAGPRPAMGGAIDARHPWMTPLGNNLFSAVQPRVELLDVTIDGFHAAQGGGIIQWEDTLTLRRSRIVGTSADHGSAIWKYRTWVRLIDSAIVGTTTGSTVLDLSEWTTWIENSTLAGNLGLAAASVIENKNSGTVRMRNVTIAENKNFVGGAIGGRTFELSHVLFANPKTGGAPGASQESECALGVGGATSLGWNFLDNAEGCGISMTATDLFGSGRRVLDPMLDALQSKGGPEFFPLMPGSPSLDSGNSAAPNVLTGGTCLPTDQTGTPRPQGQVCDRGATEQ